MIKTKLPTCVNDGKIFVYDGIYLKAVSFVNGFKHDKLKELKDIIKNNGFNYDFTYECYMSVGKNAEFSEKEYKDYRKERDGFINDYLHWKISNEVEV